MKTVFVTGASRGIGCSLVKTFVSKGYRAIATDISFTNSELPESEMIDRITLDVRSREQWEKVWKEVLSKYSNVDVFINNAGVVHPNFVESLILDEIDRQVDINLKGVMYGSKLAVDHFLSKNSGNLINIASMASLSPIQGLSIYSATKFGVRAFTLAMSMELKHLPIQVSVICPDVINTNMIDVQLEHEAANLTFATDKVISPDELANEVYRQAIIQKKLEIIIPPGRAFLAKLGNFMPSQVAFVGDMLAKKGNKKRLQMQQERRGTHS